MQLMMNTVERHIWNTHI